MSKRLDREFDHHAPTEGKLAWHMIARTHYKKLAEWIEAYCPDGQSKEIALIRLKESMMWANSSIACHIPEED